MIQKKRKAKNCRGRTSSSSRFAGVARWHHYRTLSPVSDRWAQTIIYVPNRSLSGLTIPPEVIVTSSRPDLVIHYPEANVIKIIELTVPFETNIEKEHTYKTNKYATLIQDIEDKQISSELTCVEVGCRGYVSESNKIRITTILKSLDIKPSKRQVKELTVSISKIALLTSFKCKDEPQWFEGSGVVRGAGWPSGLGS